MNATDVALAGIFIGFISGLSIVAYGFIHRRQRTDITDLPQSPINSITQGPVKITGTVVPKGSQTFVGPVTGQRCVLSEYRVDRYDRDEAHWRRAADGREFFSFYVDDGTGRVRIDPSNASLAMSRANIHETTVYKRDSTPESVKTFIDRVPSVNSSTHQSSVFGSYDYNPKRRYMEDSITVGDTVYVFGTARADATDEVADVVITNTESDGNELLISDEEQPDSATRTSFLFLIGAAVSGFSLVLFSASLLLL